MNKATQQSIRENLQRERSIKTMPIPKDRRVVSSKLRGGKCGSRTLNMVRHEEQDRQIHREERALRSSLEYCGHANNARDEDNQRHLDPKSNSNLGDHGKDGRKSAQTSIAGAEHCLRMPCVRCWRRLTQQNCHRKRRQTESSGENHTDISVIVSSPAAEVSLLSRFQGRWQFGHTMISLSNLKAVRDDFIGAGSSFGALDEHFPARQLLTTYSSGRYMSALFVKRMAFEGSLDGHRTP